MKTGLMVGFGFVFAEPGNITIKVVSSSSSSSNSSGSSTIISNRPSIYCNSLRNNTT